MHIYDPEGRLFRLIPGYLDTRGRSAAARFHVVIWSLGYCYQIYGLFRSSALKRVRIDRGTLGPDMVLLAELSLVGAFACLDERLIFIRKMVDFGSWDKYLQKLNKQLTRWSAFHLYWELISDHMNVARAHVCSSLVKALLVASVILSMLVRHHRMFVGLLLEGLRK